MKKDDTKVEQPVTENADTVNVAGDIKVKVEKKPKEDDMVQIKREDFNQLMSRVEKLTQDSELLMKASDKQRLAKARGDGGEILIRQAKVSTWDDTGKFIIGWKLMSNRCEVVLGRWVEEQTVNIVLEDGETMTVPLLEFYRKTLKKISGDIISRMEEFDSEKNKINMFKIQFPNGKVLLINSSFVN